MANINREDKVFLKFILTFFRVQGILYTRIGIDELDRLIADQLVMLKEYLTNTEKETNKSGEVLKMLQISFILIFIAHSTISDATKEVQQQMEGDP